MISASVTADMLTYLVAAGTTTAKDAQAPVWADYLNAEIPHLRSTELRPAARRAIKDWDTNGRGWQINVETIAKALRTLRKERLEQHNRNHAGTYFPDDLRDEPETACAWLTAWNTGIGSGLDGPQAEQHAWNTIGRQPSPPQLPADNKRGKEKARHIIQQLANKKAKDTP